VTPLRFKPAWRDLDALGHVNNAVYSTWLENAREAWWRAVAGPFDLFPFLLARTEIDFRAPVAWKDEVELTVRVSRVGTSSFELTYALDSGGRRIADAKTVQVMYDHAARRTVPIAAELRAKLEARA
jgi:acyl-CoA thioester hydrolase